MTGASPSLPGVHSPSAEAEAAALAFAAALPIPGVACTAHVGAAVPAEYLAQAVAASFSTDGGSLDLAVILPDSAALVQAGGAVTARSEDVLRPAFEAAGRATGPGVLNDPVSGASGLFSRPDSALFDLVGPSGLIGWFVVIESPVSARPAATGAPAQPDIRQRLRRIGGVQMTLSVEVGRTQIPVREVLDIQQGTVLTLDRQVGSPAEVYLNGRAIAHGEIVVVDGVFAIRITQVLDQSDDV